MSGRVRERLDAAFAVDSSAVERYAYFEAVAEVEGNADAAVVFHQLAETTACAAHGHLDLLRQLDDPAHPIGVGDTRRNVLSAITAEIETATTIYRALIDAAHEDAALDVASWGTTVLARSQAHVARLEQVLDALDRSTPAEASRGATP